MEQIIEILSMILKTGVHAASILLELFGAIILVYRGLKGFIEWCAKKEEASIHLAEGIATALEFLMAGEVLHTILAQDVTDLIILGALVVLRGIMTYEIHWELKHEKAEINEKKKAGGH